jgi:hypothetical protein
LPPLVKGPNAGKLADDIRQAFENQSGAGEHDTLDRYEHIGAAPPEYFSPPTIQDRGQVFRAVRPVALSVYDPVASGGSCRENDRVLAPGDLFQVWPSKRDATRGELPVTLGTSTRQEDAWSPIYVSLHDLERNCEPVK